MTDHELEKLKDLPVPAPRAEARSAALAAARAAFDASLSASGENSPEPAQGSADVIRLTEHNSPRRRRFMTSFKPSTALAASLATLMIAAPAVFYISSRMAPKLDRGPSQASPADSSDVAAIEGTVAEKHDADRARRFAKRAEMERKKKFDLAQMARETAARQKENQHEERLAGLINAPEPPQKTLIDKSRRAGHSIAPGAVDASGPTRQVQLLPPAPPPAAAPRAFAEKREFEAYRPAAPGIYLPEPRYPYEARSENRDRFESAPDNPVKQVATEPVSTFSIDVDTASYSFVRRALNAGQLPPKDAVRVEEMINYFPYAYPRPESAEVPFQPTVTVMPSPWHAGSKLVHIGIKGYDLKSAERPHANLVLLIDVSGSMGPEDRLPLLKIAFRMLLDELKPDDTVSIVTYASDTRVALEPTKAAERGKIAAVIDSLQAGGGTYGEGGIQKAYALAEENFDSKGVNRIILSTDGDFNIGITDQGELKRFIEKKRDSGIFLSVIGVGHGNYNDAMMQTLAQNGNGTAAYVDTLSEARKVLVDEASSTLFTIAKDVKIQLEFNPARVSEYRLVGYETRALKREDFNNDKIDAGDIGSGHTVTAIYEVAPAGAAILSDPLRYSAAASPDAVRRVGNDTPDLKVAGTNAELGFLKIRYKLPKEDASKLVSLAISPSLEVKSLDDAPADVRFSVAVAGFGQLLRGEPYTGSVSYDDLIGLAQSAKGDDPFGYRAEFLNLVRLAKSARP